MKGGDLPGSSDAIDIFFDGMTGVFLCCDLVSVFLEIH